MALITQSPGTAVQSREGYVLPAWLSWFKSVFLLCFSVQESGTTADRPTSTLWVGRRYFDTTLGKPVWVKQVIPSVVWVDATGASV